MATVATPRRRLSIGRRPLIIGLVLLLVVGGIAAATLLRGAPTATGTIPGWTREKAELGTIDAAISATGNVAAQAQAELRFAGDGRVTEILVGPGDQVRAGQALARIEAIDAELALASAQADLKTSEATLADLTNGATELQLREARAQLAQAQARYDQAAAQVTSADVAAAQSRVEQARARLAQLEGGPRDEDRRESEAALARAQAALQAQRDSLSAAKTQAELELQRSVTDLTRAQQSYATAKQQWEFVRDTNQDPTNPTIRDASGKEVRNRLNDVQRQQYYDAFVTAEQALRAAEVGVERAQVSYDSSRQAEVSGVTEAEQQLVSAQAGYDRTIRGATADQLAEARAALSNAQAELARLTGANRAGSLAAAQADVEIAQTRLETLTGTPDPAELTRAEASVARAQVAVEQAQRALDRTTLVAPFDATVARVDLRVGEQAAANGVIAIVDMRSFHIDVPVDELDVARLQPGQPVVIALDALADRELAGTVATIAPLATRTERGTNTYQVTVNLDEADPAVKPGMTASVQIVTERKENVVLVPRRALQSEDGATYVLVPTADPAQAANAQQPGERREVTVGLSNGQSAEIVSGLQPGEEVLVPDVVQTFSPSIRGE